MSLNTLDIINAIEKNYPKELALSWDNPGLICGRSDKPVMRVLVALDADNRTVDKAVAEDIDLIVTHHPMIFSPVKQINDSSFIGRKLLKLIKNDICCYAMHTNFDIAKNGMAAAVAKRLGLDSFSILEPSGLSDGEEVGIGFVGELKTEDGMSALELSKKIKECFGLSSLWYYDAGRPIKRIAVCPGSGKSMTEAVLFSGADAFISGDTGHHDGLDYIDDGISLIDAGHYGLEQVFMDVMTDFLTEHFPDVIIVKEAGDEREFV